MVFNLPSSPVSTDSSSDSATDSRGKIGFCGIFPRMGFAGPSSPASPVSDTRCKVCFVRGKNRETHPHVCRHPPRLRYSQCGDHAPKEDLPCSNCEHSLGDMNDTFPRTALEELARVPESD